MRSAHYNVEQSIQLELERYKDSERVRDREAKRIEQAEKERKEWWLRWESAHDSKMRAKACIASGHQDEAYDY